MRLAVKHRKVQAYWVSNAGDHDQDRFIKVYREKDGTQRLLEVGAFDMTTRTYHKFVDVKRHFFKEFRGFGISEDILEVCKLMAIEKVQINTDRQAFTFNLLDFTESNLVWGYGADMQRIVGIDCESPREMPAKYRFSNEQFTVKSELQDYGVGNR